MAFDKAYLDEVVETQGKLFDYVAYTFPDKDTEDFIVHYLTSKTKKYMDAGQAYILTMDAKDLFEYFCKNDGYKLKKGSALKGFMVDWIGEFYALYQWMYDLSGSEVLTQVPLSYLKTAYFGLHDLDLDLAVKKVGKV